MNYNASLLLYQYLKKNGLKKLSELKDTTNLKSSKRKVLCFSTFEKYLKSFQISNLNEVSTFKVFLKFFPKAQILVVMEDFYYCPIDKEYQALQGNLKEVKIHSQKDLKKYVKFSHTDEQENFTMGCYQIKNNIYFFDDIILFQKFFKSESGYLSGLERAASMFFTTQEIEIKKNEVEKIISDWENGLIKTKEKKFLATGRNPLSASKQKESIKEFLLGEYQADNNNLIFNIKNKFKNHHILIGLFYFELYEYINIKSIVLVDDEIRCVVDFLPRMDSFLVKSPIPQNKNEYLWGTEWKLIWNEHSPLIEYQGRLIRPQKNGLRSGYLKILKALLDAPTNFLTTASIREIMGTGDLQDDENTKIHNAISNLKNKGKAYFIKVIPKKGYKLEKNLTTISKT